ncbi:MAG: hypothetical protein HeimC3_53600 [Candidatus Heimdallarchaeota archaeon LC_3]|nr:MAG: hypothetical protein HeimC3_53600 [Candidatus Heimdallarchaeota archaeon LC_3]
MHVNCINNKIEDLLMSINKDNKPNGEISNFLIPDELITEIKKIPENSLQNDMIFHIYRDINVKNSLRSFFRINDNHSKQNAIGQMYEVYCYFLLLTWAKNHPKVSNFVLKGPNLKKIPEESKIPHGIRYNKEKQIVYESSGYSIAEYDAIFVWNNIPVFIEVKKGIGIREETYRKINLREKLLRKVFQTKKVICLFINPDIDIPNKIYRLPFFESILIPIPEKITKKLLQRNYRDPKNELKIITGEKIITLPIIGTKNIPYKIIETNLVGDIRKTLRNEITMTKFFEKNREYLGIIYRLLIGEISPNQYQNFIEFINQQFDDQITIKPVTKIVIGINLYPEKNLTPFIILIKGKKDKIYRYQFHSDYTSRKLITKQSSLYKELGVFKRKQKLNFEYFELFYNKRKQLIIPSWRNIK